MTKVNGYAIIGGNTTAMLLVAIDTRNFIEIVRFMVAEPHLAWLLSIVNILDNLNFNRFYTANKQSTYLLKLRKQSYSISYVSKRFSVPLKK
jgi:hypothetical protein